MTGGRCLTGFRARTASALLALAAAPAAAFPEPGLDGGLALQRAEVDLRAATGGSVATRTTRAGVFLWDDSRPWLQLGIEGGPLLISQTGNPATAGAELHGSYLGFGLRSAFLRTPALDLVLAASYTYQRGEQDDGGRDVVLSWGELRGELAATLKLPALSISGGGYLLEIDGEQAVAGEETLILDSPDAGGAFIAASFAVDATGRIGLRAETGARRSLELVFARRF